MSVAHQDSSDDVDEDGGGGENPNPAEAETPGGNDQPPAQSPDMISPDKGTEMMSPTPDKATPGASGV